MAPDATALSASGAQMGDAEIEAAGRDIVHGMDPAAALSFVRDYLFQSDHQRDIRDAEIGRRIDRLADALELHEISEAQRRAADDRARATRQRRLDLWLAALTVGLCVGFALLAWLLIDRYTALALARLWLGAALALGLVWRRA